MRRTPAILAGVLLLAPRALLAAQVNCAETEDPLACRMHEVLSWLHFAAAALVIVLLAVTVIVVRIVRRNRRSADPFATRPRPGADSRKPRR